MSPSHQLVEIASPWVARAELDAFATRRRLEALRGRAVFTNDDGIVPSAP
jgi:hypothetical protein